MGSVKRRVGKTYEAFMDVVLCDLSKVGVLPGSVYWNEIPPSLEIEPDFYAAEARERPLVIFMVSHSDSSKESNRKYLRSVAEMVEAKVRLEVSPLCINVIFDATIKNDVKKLGAATFDSQLIVGEKDYGLALRKWVESNECILPIDQVERAAELVRLSKTDTELQKLISKLKTDLAVAIKSANESTKSLWEHLRKRRVPAARKYKVTAFRRGITKRFLVGQSLLPHGRVSSVDAVWLGKLGIVKKMISGWQIVDEDLMWFIRSTWENNYSRIATRCASEGFLQQVEKVKNLSAILPIREYILANYRSLVTPDGMERVLQKLNRNPAVGLDLPTGVMPPKNIWMYDFVASLAKASTGMSQSFGYSAFATHALARSFKVGSMYVGQWCTHFICEYFNRRLSKPIDGRVLTFVSTVLSDELKKYSTAEIARLSAEIESKYIVKEYEDTLLSHRGFDPLLSVLVQAGVLGSDDQILTKSIRTCFAERAGLKGQSGAMVVANLADIILGYRSACKNPRDKRKELCASAVGLRYTWDAKVKKFKPRPGVKKLVLLLDGTWTQKDLNALVAAGWDEIYYPDEIDKLKASVLGTDKKGGVTPKLAREDGAETLSMAADEHTMSVKRSEGRTIRPHKA